MCLNKKLVCIVALLLGTFAANAKSIKIGVHEYPPHILASKKEVSGPFLTFLKQLFQNEYQDIQFVYLPSKRGVRELSKGNIDLLFPYLEQGEQLPVLNEPVLNVVPGLCFKKQNYIPFLSAPGAMDGLNIGVPANLPLVPIFDHSSVNLKVIEGSDVLHRGIQLLLRDRIDGLYHPSPINVYHHSNPLSKEIACSLFYGYSRPVNIALSPKLTEHESNTIEKIYAQHIQIQPYEYFLLNTL